MPKIQDGLNAFQEWCFNNRMKLNIKKSKSLVIGTGFKTSGLNRFKLNDIPLDNVTSYNYLGVILDSNMTLSPLNF